MPSTSPPVVLITGGSSGFGYLATLKFARQGWQVFAGVRKLGHEADELKNIAQKEKIADEIKAVNLFLQTVAVFDRSPLTLVC